MARKCFISFKAEDMTYKQVVQTLPELEVIDKSLNEPINSTNEDYILRKIRSECLADSTVTIHLIGLNSAENKGSYEQRYIKRELQASLYHSEDNTRNGILGIVLPEAEPYIFRGSLTCWSCGGIHNHVVIDDTTTVKEFSYNYYVPNDKCAHTEDDRYCVLTNWDSFLKVPNSFVEAAFKKRMHPIVSKIRVRPI